MFNTIFTNSNVILAAVSHLAAAASHSKTAAASSSASGSIIYLLFMVLIVYVGWRLIFRPQSQRAKQQRQAMSMLSEGDDIITTAGIYGTILEIDGDKVHVRVSDNCVLTMARGSIAQRLTVATSDDDSYGSGSATASSSDGSSYDEPIDDYGAGEEGIGDYGEGAEDEESEGDDALAGSADDDDEYEDDIESGAEDVKSKDS